MAWDSSAKRLEHLPNSDPPRVWVITDNPLYKPYEGSGEEVNIIGQILWFALRCERGDRAGCADRGST